MSKAREALAGARMALQMIGRAKTLEASQDLAAGALEALAVVEREAQSAREADAGRKRAARGGTPRPPDRPGHPPMSVGRPRTSRDSDGVRRGGEGGGSIHNPSSLGSPKSELVGEGVQGGREGPADAEGRADLPNERYVATTDPLTDLLREAAVGLGIPADVVAGVWVKFTGQYDGSRVPSVCGWWQRFCQNEVEHRLRRERERPSGPRVVGGRGRPLVERHEGPEYPGVQWDEATQTWKLPKASTG